MFDNIKIAFFDLDGTLTNSDLIITDYTIDALKRIKEKGILLAISSGRCFNHMLKYNKDIDIFDFVISNNGACIIDLNTKKLVHEEILNNTQLDLVINFCKSNNYKVLLNGFENQYTLEDNYLSNTIYQFVIIVGSKNDVEKLIDFTDKNNLKIPYISFAYYSDIPSDKYTVNINLLTTDKGKSIKLLLDYLNIEKEDSLCFGDNFNDLKMFDNCGIKVAMKNGLQELKDKADFITLSNDEDGVAHFLNQYI